MTSIEDRQSAGTTEPTETVRRRRVVDPRSPWRIDTNDRFRDVVTAIMSLATASLLLPVFLARDFSGAANSTALRQALTTQAFASWALFGLSILAAIFYLYVSAKWVRLAWGFRVTIFRVKARRRHIERILEISFWLTVVSFLSGLALVVMWFSGQLSGSVPNAAAADLFGELGL